MHTRIFSLALALSCSCLFSEQNEPQVLGPNPLQIHGKHVEPKGIGFNTGYSSLDLFFPVPLTDSSFVPLLDLRGHIFNNGNWAASGGFGFRYLSQPLKTVFGTNAFYDYRSSHRGHYNQLSLGFEALRKKWDFRANGYAIISQKQSSPYDRESRATPFLTSSTAKRQYAFSGFDTEAGYYFPEAGYCQFYTSGGVYFYTSPKAGKSTTGGKLKVDLSISKYLTMEGSVTYDHLFRWIGQGVVGFTIPLGPREKMSQKSVTLHKRLYQTIDRNEIIVLKGMRKSTYSYPTLQ